jgi:hypothetical protein
VDGILGYTVTLSFPEISELPELIIRGSEEAFIFCDDLDGFSGYGDMGSVSTALDGQ